MTTKAVPRRSRRTTHLVALGLSAALGAALVPGAATAAFAAPAPPASAAASSCAAQSSSTRFSPWGDTNSYFLMPGGSFESGAPGWTLTGGAKVATGNESAYLTSHTDTHSLSLPAGAQATSPSVCVQGGNMMRLFAKNSGDTSSVLHVTTYAKNPATGLVFSHEFDVTSTTNWGTPASLFMPTLMGTEDLTMVFTTSGAATWNIDDVYVDPFKSR